MDLLEIQLSDDEEQIYAPLKRKWLKNTPEEAVRQEYIRCLVNDYGYTLDQMEQEYQSAIPGRGTGGAFADIVVWAKSNDKNNRKDALIVVECKAPSVTLSKKECGQLINYASDLNAKFLILTNRKETLFFKLKEGVRPAQIGDLIKINDIPNAQQAKQYSGKTFSFSVPIGLLPRDKEADNLFNCVIANSFFNLVGVGGSGKSSLASLMIQKHEEDFNEIAYVVVNNNIKNDFVEQINKTLRLEFEKGEDDFSELIDHLQNDFKSEHPNLLVLDINETSDKTKNDEIINTIIKTKDLLNGWKILILSREKVDTRNRIDTHNLNDNEDVEFLKELFLQKAGERYNDFDDFAELFKIVFYNPLLTEQLALYLHNDPEPATIEDIKKILYGASFKEEDMQGLSADRHDETIVSFLTNLIKYNDFNDNEKNLLRHFVLWQAEYIGYEVIKDLLNGVFASDDDLKNTLKSLSKRAILDTNNNQTLGYKLHGLLAESLREQIDVENEDYNVYLGNIERIIEYSFSKFRTYADFVGNSLCEYNITSDYRFIYTTANRFKKAFMFIYANKLFNNVSIIIQRLINYTVNDDHKNLTYLAILFKDLANLQRDHLVDYHTAESNYLKAIEIRNQLPKDNTENQNDLANLYNDYARLQFFHLNQYASAELYYHKAIEIRKKLPNDNPKYQIDLANTYNDIARFYDYVKKYVEERTCYNKAIEICEKLPNDNPEYQNELAYQYTCLASFCKNVLNDFKSAHIYYQKAIDICEQLPKENIDYQGCLIKSYNNLADLQCNILKDYKSAELNYQKALTIRVPLSKDNHNCQYQLADAYHNLAILQIEHLGKYESAATNILEEIEIRKKFPKTITRLTIKDLANAYSNLAILYKEHLEDYKSSESLFKKEIEMREQLPQNTREYQKDLVYAYNSLALLQSKYLYDFESAQNNYHKAIVILEQLTPHYSFIQQDLANTYLKLANLQTNHLFAYKSAETNYLKSIDIRERLIKREIDDFFSFDDYMNDPDFKYNLAMTYNKLAHCYNRQQKYNEAIAVNNKAIDIAQKLSETDSKYLIELINYKYTLAEIYFDTNDIDSAKSILSVIKPQVEQCLANNPDDQWIQTVNNKINDLLVKMSTMES